MKIEVGKFYKTRNGRKVGPMERNDDNNYESEWEFSGPDGYTYRKDGTFGIDGTERDRDLIAEWTDTPEVGTLQEIGAQVGDRVKWRYGAQYTIGRIENGVYFEDDDDEGYLSHEGGWSIISRAQPKPEQTGPVRTVTRTTREIVPGVYGPLTIRATDEGGPVQLEINGTTGRTWFNKDDIDALVLHLTAIRDALKENGE